MTFENLVSTEPDAGWLFDLGEGRSSHTIDGLIVVDTYDPTSRPAEEVATMEKARSYGAHSVFFEAAWQDRRATPQAFIFLSSGGGGDDLNFALLHKRLWSWGGVPLLYRTAPGRIELFRCAHEPDFAASGDVPICRPIRTLLVGAKIAASEIWWDASRIRNGTLWDDPDACRLMLSAKKSAHRKLVEEVQRLNEALANEHLLEGGLRRRLLILSLLIAYLEERGVLLQEDFERAYPGATRFFEVLSNGSALVTFLQMLEERFNGHIFSLTDEERHTISSNAQLAHYARLIEGFEDSTGQLNLWRLYSFKDLPVELISNIYQLFVKDAATSIYTPPALVRLMLGEALGWERLDRLMMSEEIILDPACGSGVFLVEAYKRLVLHWRSHNNWQRPGVEELQPLLSRVHGIDTEPGAVELAAFSLCLALCDALEPEEIRASVKLFPPLAGTTLHHSCFFEAKEKGLVSAPVGAIIGNPPFASSISTDGARRAYDTYLKQYGALADKQLAYLFLHSAMELLSSDGILAMVQPSGFLYNHHALAFRSNFFSSWNVREILDFVSVRGIFRKGNADPKIVVVLAQAAQPTPEDRLLHAVFRRSGRAASEQGFDIDYYDLHWFRNTDAERSRDIWRANLFGGSRVLDLIKRLRQYPTLRDHAVRRGWDIGEGYIAGLKGISRPASHVVGKPLLPTAALTAVGIDASLIEEVPNQPIKDPKTARRFTPPLLLIKEHENLHHGLWIGHYLTYKHEIVGFAAPVDDLDDLRAVSRWLDQERNVLQAYMAGISARLFTQRATAILGADILALPYPEDGELDLSTNERMVAQDMVDYQRDYIRLGTVSPVMRQVGSDALTTFDAVFATQINAVYASKPLRVVELQAWPGIVCKAYAFGDGQVDWSGAEQLRDKLNALLRERRGSSLTITRIARVYDENFLFLLKPDRHRFWTRSVALRDADDVLADLRAQGF